MLRILALVGTRDELSSAFSSAIEIRNAYPTCKLSTSKLLKSLPEQPKPPQNAARRAKNHAEDDAVRKPRERLLNKTNLGVRGKSSIHWPTKV